MKQRIMVLCDDAWHPAEIVRRGLETLADCRFDFQFIADGRDWSPTEMGKFPLVMVAKGNHFRSSDINPWLTVESESAFSGFVQNGGGLFIIHGGTCYKDSPKMRSVIGGAFERHSDQCAVTIEPKAEHPLTTGLNPFTVNDEHYIMALDDANARVFLQSRSEHGVQPAGWTRSLGRGRVCVLTPGHTLEVWLHPGFQKLLHNGLNWLVKFN